MLKKRSVMFAIVGIGLILTILLAINVGSISVPLSEMIPGLLKGEGGNIGIIRDIRLPRIAVALLVGASLSVSGVLLQAVMRNPLADPGITGISSGASVAAIIVMLYIPGAIHSLPLFGFLGGLAACALIYSLAWKGGINAIRIVLAGVAVNAVLGGMSGMLSIINSEKLSGVLMWLNGNIGNKSWEDVGVLFVYTVIGLIIALPLFKNCNILALGDKAATSLGVNVNRQRIIISAVAVFLAGVSTSIAGVIGFIGLVVPHISRMIIGSDHKYLIPYSALLGSLVLLVADTCGRIVAKPYEIPVGIVMAVVGGPFFLYLLRKGDATYGG